jgi:hypothetical protein
MSDGFLSREGGIEFFGKRIEDETSNHGGREINIFINTSFEIVLNDGLSFCGKIIL